MSKKIPQQNLPHFGIKNNFERHGRLCIETIHFQEKCGQEPILDAEGQPMLGEDGQPMMKPIFRLATRTKIYSFVSISAAKHFMRTGERK